MSNGYYIDSSGTSRPLDDLKIEGIEEEDDIEDLWGHKRIEAELTKLHAENERLRDGLAGNYPQSTVYECRTSHLQNCSWCPRFECCDNTTPQGTIESLRSMLKKTRAENERLRDELKQERDWGGQGSLWGDLAEFLHLDEEFTDCAADVTDAVKTTLAALRAENERLRACHEAELGVCEKYCEVVKRLKRIEAAIAGAEIIDEGVRNQSIEPYYWVQIEITYGDSSCCPGRRGGEVMSGYIILGVGAVLVAGVALVGTRWGYRLRRYRLRRGGE